MPGVSLAAAPRVGHSRGSDRSRFGALPLTVQVGVSLVASMGIGATAYGLANLSLERWPLVLGLLMLSVLTNAAVVSLPLARGGSALSTPYITNVLSFILLGPWATVPLAVAGAWSGCVVRERDSRSWYRTVFTLGSTAMSVAAAGLVYRGGTALLPQEYWAGMAAVLGAATIYFLVTTGLVGLVMAASAEGHARTAIENRILSNAPGYYAGAILALLFAEVARGGRYWWAVAFAIPAYLAFRSYTDYIGRVAEDYRRVKEISDVHFAMVQALALAIEAKDNTTHAQVERIQAYSEGLARALSMTGAEVQGVRTAALLHDIGNLAVPENILSKPGRLTYEEYDRLKIHPRVGADIISSVPFPYPVAPLVLAHHERWDGRGYPAGLKGTDIPLGARIIAVVDCFTSMLTERPYRPSHTYAEAIATLRENGGSALDPGLVEKFIEILPSIEFGLQQPPGSVTDLRGPARPPTQEGPATALADIAVARREEQMLRDIGQSLSSSLRVSDALSLISTRLVGMMPLDACALFLREPTAQLFMCSHVVGSHQEAIRGTTAGTIESLGAAPPSAPATILGTAVRLQSVAVAPLVTEAGTIGALVVYHTDRNAYTADCRRLLVRVATHASNVIANALVFEQTQEQSLTDVLTGMPNRRYLERHLAQEVARVHRHHGQISVLVLDMDGFKQINDEFGHQAGDGALKEVAQVLRASLRAYDVCARLAGDEFVLVLGDCDPAQAERRRVDLQHAIASLWLEPLPGRIVSLSVSVGAATFPDDADTVEGVISVADRRMYRDKAERKRLGAGRESLTPDCLWN
jgi:diguanylate cyclase (GGDEF)-like protein